MRIAISALVLLGIVGCCPGCERRGNSGEVSEPPLAPGIVRILVGTEDSQVCGWEASGLRPAEYRQAAQMRTQLAAALQKYPPELLDAIGLRVLLVRELGRGGVRAAGTYEVEASRVVIALCAGGQPMRSTFIEGALHAEISSLLLWKKDSGFEQAEWGACNPSGFEYGSGGWSAAIEGRTGQVFRSDLLAKGFLSEYSLASIEEDFNTYSARLFTGSYPFWVAVDRFPAVRKKMEIAVSFFGRHHELLTEEYFRGLVPADPASPDAVRARRMNSGSGSGGDALRDSER